MTPLTSYHLYCHKHAISPDPLASEAVQAATLPYAYANRTATAADRELLRTHRAERANAPDLFALAKTPAQLARTTGLSEPQAIEALNAWRHARGLKPYTLPKPRRTPPAYVPPPPLNPADPLADYHARIGIDDAIRFSDLRRLLGVSEHVARRRYVAWCAEQGVSPRTSPTGQARPWLAYALARRTEGFAVPEIAAAIGIPAHRVGEVKVKDP